MTVQHAAAADGLGPRLSGRIVVRTEPEDFMAQLTQEITVRQAYLAMFEYLRRYYERGQSDEIGSMLGGLSLLADGASADPAALSDFLDSIDAVMHEERGGGYGGAEFKLRR